MSHWHLVSALVLCASVCVSHAVTPALLAISYSRDVAPILQANCAGCHRPARSKGHLDLTSYASLMRGGDEGPAVVPSRPEASPLLQQVAGPEPSMPKEAEPLIAREIETIRTWILQGAIDDTASADQGSLPPTEPVYRRLPAVTAMSWAPASPCLAIAGWHEVTLHDTSPLSVPGASNAATRIARLIGASPRIESLAFSVDGSLLAVSGGVPSESGEIQIWDVRSRSLKRSIRATRDTLFGISISQDGTRIAVGGADKIVRVFSTDDGREIMKCDNHIDWVFGTAFSLDGTRLVSASRDKALKLIDISTGLLIDDICRPSEPLVGLARSPKEDWIVSASETGGLRLYKMVPRGGRLAEGDDKEAGFIRELERLPGPARSVTISGDGEWVAAAGYSGEVRIYRVEGGQRMASVQLGAGPIHALALSPDHRHAAAAGYDGRVRILDTFKGQVIGVFDPVPLNPSPQ